MKSPSLRTTLKLALFATALIVAAGCAKKAVETPPSPQSPPPVPGQTPSTPSTPAPETPSSPSAPSPGGASGLQPAFFDYDSDVLTAEARAVLDGDARILRESATMNVVIEGHCDERGTAEYNQSLGERRAQAARDYLIQAGIAQNRLRVISYGKERPFATGADESSYAQNRRAHLTVQ